MVNSLSKVCMYNLMIHDTVLYEMYCMYIHFVYSVHEKSCIQNTSIGLTNRAYFHMYMHKHILTIVLKYYNIHIAPWPK